MKRAIYKFTLDLLSNLSKVSVPCSVGDTAIRLVINLTSRGLPYHIDDGCKAVLVGKKPDKTELVNDCSIENNAKIIYDFTPQTTNVAGVVECEIRIFEDGEDAITTPKFNICPEARTVDADDITNIPLPSGNELDALDDILRNEDERMKAEEERTATHNLFIEEIQTLEEVKDQVASHDASIGEINTEIEEINDKLKQGIPSSGDMLYRHDLRLFGDWYSSQFEIFITIFNTDPTEYTIEEDIDIDDEGQEYPLGVDISNLNFLPKDKWIPCTGCYGTAEGDFGDYSVYAIKIRSDRGEGVVAEIATIDIYSRSAYTVHYDDPIFLQDTDTREITDTVTEVGSVSVSGGGSGISENKVQEMITASIGDLEASLDEILALQDYYTGATFDELHEYAEAIEQGGAE